MATFEYMHHALAHPLAGVDAGQVVAGVFDHATADFGTLGAHQPGDRLERGALAGAIGAEQGDDRALGHAQRHPRHGEDRAVVDHFDVVDRQRDIPHLENGLAHAMSRLNSASHTGSTTDLPVLGGCQIEARR
jgi:hypothetical protein